MGNFSKTIHLYFAVDVSGSMHGEKIEKVHAMLQDFSSGIRDLADAYDINTYVHALTFGNGVQWCVGNAEKGENVSGVAWKHFNATDNKTESAKAISEITQSIESKKKDLNSRVAVVLVTDGKCTEGEDKYIDACNVLANKLEPTDKKMAVDIEGASLADLEIFTGNSQNIYKIYEIDGMIDCLKGSYSDFSAAAAVKPKKSEDWI